MIEEDLLQFIVDLDTAAKDRVYIGNNTEKKVVHPFVVLRRGGGNSGRTLSGTPLFSRVPFEIHVIHLGMNERGGGGYASAVPLANAIKDAMNAFSPGLMGDTIVESARIQTEPFDTSETVGEKTTRWLQMEALIVHK